MKSTRIIILEKILGIMAKAVLLRRKPRIVAITGSVGKTSTKTAVFEVLKTKFKVRENQKNYNNEIGIPLTIIGAESGGKNLLKWFLVFSRWLGAVTICRYPEILILELGVDRPGDMAYFMTFLNPTVGIVTNIGTSHLEYFHSMENIAKEKGTLIASLKKESFAILNSDDRRVLDMQKNTAAKVVTFGKAENSTVNAANIVYNYTDGKPTGISFKLSYAGKTIPIRLKNILAAHQVYAALAAICSGIALKMNLVEISQALENLSSPVGRMNLLKGKNESYLIDDTYNAAPLSTVAAIEVLSKLQAQRRIAVLGDMLELGEETKSGHQEVGKKIFEAKTDLFLAVGERMRSAVAELVSLGYPEENILQFDDPVSAGEKVAEILEPGDFVLVKGSQGMRMEKVLEQILASSENAEKVLCRQSKDWKKKPFAKP